MRNSKKNQQNGGSYQPLFYAQSPSNMHELNAYTTKNIGGSPVFQPLNPNAKFATGFTGIVPT